MCLRRPYAGRLLLTAAMLLVAGVVATPSAPAAQSQPTLTLDPTSGPPGSVVDATGTGFPPDPFVAVLRLDDPDAGPVLADDVPITPQGTFATAFVIPPGTPVGGHVVHACVRRSSSPEQICDRLPTAPLRVTAPPATTSSTVGTTTSPPPPPPPPGQVGVTTLPPDTTTSTTEIPGEVAVATTTTSIPPFGAADLVGPPTTHGLGLGELQGNEADWPDLSIVGMEITQGIQNLANKMPLVAQRTTVIRVHVKTNGGTMPHVSGLMQLVRGGTNEIAVIEPDNGPITATGAEPDRLDADASLNFTLPAAATHVTKQGDRLIATAFVFGTHPTTPANLEPTDANNFKAGVFDFQSVGPFVLHLLPMHMHELPEPSSPVATVGTSLTDLFSTAATVTSLYRYLPVHDIQVVPGPVVYPPYHGTPSSLLPPSFSSEWDLTKDGVESSILSTVQAVWAETSTTSNLEQYYGIFRAELPRTWGGFSNGTVAYGFVNLLSHADWPWYHQGGWLAAHELGHSIGFSHVNCKGSEGSPGPYPYEDPCRLAPVDPDGWYGWDIRHASFTATDGPSAISNDPDDVVAGAYPYMGYKGPKWADPWFYCRSLKRFGGTCTALSIPENQIEPPDALPEAVDQPYQPAPGQTGWLLVEALLSEPDPLLLTTKTVPAPLPHVLDEYARRRADGQPTGVIARVVDRRGGVLGLIELQATSGPSSGHGQDDDLASPDASPPVLGTSDYLPWFPAAAAIQLVRDGTVVAERPVSAHPPTIEIVTPAGGSELSAPLTIAWEASDPDGDPLAFDVAYSPDGGETWQALAHLLADTSYTLSDFGLIAGGDQAVFRVTALDGVHATSATSEPARVPDQPPSVVVLSPGDGTVLPLHAPVVLHASASDREDGPDAPLQVVWTSDVDGSLGEGSHLVTRTLSAGEHRITATAFDGVGSGDRHTVTITIDADQALPRLDADGFVAGIEALREGPVAPLELASAGTRTGTGNRAVWASALLAGLAVVAAGIAVRRGRAARR